MKGVRSHPGTKQCEHLTYRCLDLPVSEDALKIEVEFAHVILAETILVPAHAFEQGYANDGELKDDIPFGVQRLADAWCRFLRFAERNNEKLVMTQISHFR